MKQITLMFKVPDTARADILLSSDRIYYRFSTIDTDDEGDLPGLKDNFEMIATRIIEAIKPQNDEIGIEPNEIKTSIFIDNVLQDIRPSEASLKRAVKHMINIDDAFHFLNGFIA